ncbi:MAG: V-type ATP synthase subunit E [Firmicutes bacterium]|nr:V-type ATP synthase subunit E [Bacillota bacterium]
MAGIDNILARIEQDSAAKCAEILANARAEAGEILAAATARAARENEAALAEARRKAEACVASAGPRAAQDEKRALLQMKNEVLGQAAASALARLRALPEAEYFGVLARLAAACAQEGPGEMRLSQRDLDRLPAGFAAALGDIAIAPQAADIPDGFVLVYGDVEQNCTFGALVSVRMDDIKDALHAHIFA